ncbi:MAG: hypothetical protein DWQ02_26420 [Bacteroidetes bacterium]|nr:MAG: hypothetical protein DWQ02_26420 [Bacteroidota bacterium]
MIKGTGITKGNNCLFFSKSFFNLGLGSLYVTDERFKAYYEKFRPGLAHFVNESIKVFCKHLK